MTVLLDCKNLRSIQGLQTILAGQLGWECCPPSPEELVLRLEEDPRGISLVVLEGERLGAVLGPYGDRLVDLLLEASRRPGPFKARFSFGVSGD